MLLVKKCNDFHYLFSLKIGLEIRFNNIINRKETLFDYENKNFITSQKWHFPKGLSHDFGQKMPLFSLFVFGQNKTRNSTYFVQKNEYKQELLI